MDLYFCFIVTLLNKKLNFDFQNAVPLFSTYPNIAGTFELQVKRATDELEEFDSSDDESLSEKKSNLKIG